MTYMYVFAMLFMIASAVNLIHWHGRKGERVQYRPQTARLRILFHLLPALLIATGAILFLLHIIPAAGFGIPAFIFAIANEIYSVARRQRDRRRV